MRATIRLRMLRRLSAGKILYALIVHLFIVLICALSHIHCELCNATGVKRRILSGICFQLAFMALA
jgi:hypothetical protein